MVLHNTDILSNVVCRLGGLLLSTPPARQRVSGRAVGDRGDYRLLVRAGRTSDREGHC